MENLNYKNKIIGKKYLKIMQKNQFLKVKKSFRIKKRFYRVERYMI